MVLPLYSRGSLAGLRDFLFRGGYPAAAQKGNIRLTAGTGERHCLPRMATAQPLMDSAPWRQSRRNPSGRRAGNFFHGFTQAIHGAGRFLLRWIGGLALIGAGGTLAACLLTYDPGDPSLNNATDSVAQNALGIPGAYTADFLLQGFGFAAALLIPIFLVWGARVLADSGISHTGRAIVATLIAMPLGAIALGLAWPAPLANLSAGSGGVLGLFAAATAGSLRAPGAVDPAVLSFALSMLFGLLALGLLIAGIGPSRHEWKRLLGGIGRQQAADAELDEEIAPEAAPAPLPPEPAPVHVPLVSARMPEPAAPEAPPKRLESLMARVSKRKESTPAAPAATQHDPVLPPLSLLKAGPRRSSDAVDMDALERNARHLETVLDDYGVKGQIVGLSQGPVVTLYELEPAPGIKASRVIGLADDIARSMSAVSARVAVIPGRNVIGIELPNRHREMVSLSELVTSDAFQASGATLPIILGKDISGGPVITDLAPMPHLLIAGTTGSGKSVGLNAMILSLLYRMTPDQCRMIMIDPKMLELSVYDDIPHLLSPVVTEPQKAVRALKWAVEQMEERYRNMAHINVRSLSGYNERVREALSSGRSFSKRVQTGWDEEGKPEFEEVTLPLEPLPLIVVVVDELADLMMTAGKEVEFLIQRLAQKARAAGIHLIMATQRPSVDVITGVIKANLPTRISFQVTSKIDSRTILGEMGAEQLLGKGDMLYMAGGKQVVRVHGPFVSDEEVEAIAQHWKMQGSPDYISGVTEEPEGPDGFEGMGLPSGGKGAIASDDPLQQAIQIVASSRKATISYLQRQLRVGYNSAARLIEQMEEMGLVSSPDHVGRREVLMDETGNRLP